MQIFVLCAVLGAAVKVCGGVALAPWPCLPRDLRGGDSSFVIGAHYSPSARANAPSAIVNVTRPK